MHPLDKAKWRKRSIFGVIVLITVLSAFALSGSRFAVRELLEKPPMPTEMWEKQRKLRGECLKSLDEDKFKNPQSPCLLDREMTKSWNALHSCGVFGNKKCE